MLLENVPLGVLDNEYKSLIQHNALHYASRCSLQSDTGAREGRYCIVTDLHLIVTRATSTDIYKKINLIDIADVSSRSLMHPGYFQFTHCVDIHTNETLQLRRKGHDWILKKIILHVRKMALMRDQLSKTLDADMRAKADKICSKLIQSLEKETRIDADKCQSAGLLLLELQQMTKSNLILKLDFWKKQSNILYQSLLQKMEYCASLVLDFVNPQLFEPTITPNLESIVRQIKQTPWVIGKTAIENRPKFLPKSPYVKFKIIHPLHCKEAIVFLDRCMVFFQSVIVDCPEQPSNYLGDCKYTLVELAECIFIVCNIKSQISHAFAYMDLYEKLQARSVVCLQAILYKSEINPRLRRRLDALFVRSNLAGVTDVCMDFIADCYQAYDLQNPEKRSSYINTHLLICCLVLDNIFKRCPLVMAENSKMTLFKQDLKLRYDEQKYQLLPMQTQEPLLMECSRILSHIFERDRQLEHQDA